jgi:hypothetical protein
MASLCAFATPAWTQVYKWVDEAGKTHYGSTPPAGARAALVQPAAPPAPAASPPSVQPARRSPAEGMGASPEDSQARAPDRPGAAPPQAPGERLRRCAFARQQLNVLTLGGPVFRREAQGGRHYLPDDARGAEIARLRIEVAQQCAGLDSDAATQVRWREIDAFVACDRARSLLQAFDANRSRISNQEYEGVTRAVADACAPNRFAPDTGRRGEWFRQYVLPGELRQ